MVAPGWGEGWGMPFTGHRIVPACGIRHHGPSPSGGERAGLLSPDVGYDHAKKTPRLRSPGRRGRGVAGGSCRDTLHPAPPPQGGREHACAHRTWGQTARKMRQAARGGGVSSSFVPGYPIRGHRGKNRLKAATQRGSPRSRPTGSAPSPAPARQRASCRPGSPGPETCVCSRPNTGSSRHRPPPSGPAGAAP